MQKLPPFAARAEQTIALMDAAVKANESDAFRTGFLVELPAEGELFVTGDLHGNGGNLRRIIELADLSRFSRRHLVLQELVHETETAAEVCNSYRLVEMAARLKVTFPGQVHLLLGNHEFSEILDLEIGKHGRELNSAFQEGVRTAYGPRSGDVQSAYRRFWRSCPLAVRTGNRLLVCHSSPRMEKAPELDLNYLRTATSEQVFQRKSPIFALLWGRDYRPGAADEFARRMDADLLLVGHTACKQGMHAPNGRHVILDCKDMEACYALLPLDRPLTHQEVLAATRRLYPSAPEAERGMTNGE